MEIFITAVVAFISLVSAYIAFKVRGVHQEVRTLNELTIGQLAALVETRRIKAKRDAGSAISEQEQRHLDAAIR